MSYTVEIAEIRAIPLTLASARREAEAFLARFDLQLEPLDYYAGLYLGGRLAAAGGYRGRVIRCVAVDPKYQGLGLANTLVSHLCAMLRAGRAGNIFVFTRPENRDIFTSLSFYPVGEAPGAMLLEADRHGLENYLRQFSPGPGVNGAVVMNCNPFTFGHQYLAEAAARGCDWLHLLVVEEDQSVFPFAVRLELVRQGTAHLPNVTVWPGGPYIISAATFPTYFLKEDTLVNETYTRLDLDIFARRIAPALAVSKRFVGEEPFDPVTAVYNRAMAEVLPAHGIQPLIIPRKTTGGRVISASRVRQLLAEGRWEDVKGLVPETTYRYLVSPAARPVLAAIRGQGEGAIAGEERP